MKLPVAEPVGACAGIRSPVMPSDARAAGARHTPVTDAGVDSGCRNVIVSPTVQFGKATL